ncbi:MAG: hypothetical protein EPO20_03355 [Betaproteobacteria bacterium]|nr:MAG: hypothetical protein EPO20_03355 [Betaproteobacteria bacterium]
MVHSFSSRFIRLDTGRCPTTTCPCPAGTGSQPKSHASPPQARSTRMHKSASARIEPPRFGLRDISGVRQSYPGEEARRTAEAAWSARLNGYTSIPTPPGTPAISGTRLCQTVCLQVFRSVAKHSGLTKAAEASGPSPDSLSIVMEPSSPQALNGLAAIGLRFAIMPGVAVPQETCRGHLVGVRLSLRLMRNFSALYPKDEVRSQLIVTFLHFATTRLAARSTVACRAG